MQFPALITKTSACMAAALFLLGLTPTVQADLFDEDPIEVMTPPSPNDPPVVHTAQDGPDEDPLLEHTAQDNIDPGDPEENVKEKKDRGDSGNGPFMSRSDTVDPVRPPGVDGALEPLDLLSGTTAPDARDLIIGSGGDVFQPSLVGDYSDEFAARSSTITGSVYSTVPSPGALVALGVGALLQRRRRRR